MLCTSSLRYQALSAHVVDRAAPRRGARRRRASMVAASSAPPSSAASVARRAHRRRRHRAEGDAHVASARRPVARRRCRSRSSRCRAPAACRTCRSAPTKPGGGSGTRTRGQQLVRRAPRLAGADEEFGERHAARRDGCRSACDASSTSASSTSSGTSSVAGGRGVADVAAERGGVADLVAGEMVAGLDEQRQRARAPADARMSSVIVRSAPMRSAPPSRCDAAQLRRRAGCSSASRLSFTRPAWLCGIRSVPPARIGDVAAVAGARAPAASAGRGAT